MRLKKFVAIFCLAGATACGATKTAMNEPDGSNSTVNEQSLDDAANKSVPAQQKVSPAQAVSASASALNIKAGETATAEITVNIADDYHINTNPADSEYLRPTTIKINASNSIKIGAPDYPPGAKLKFAFADSPITVYTKSVVIKIPVSAAANAKSGETLLPAKIEAQPCNDNACFPSRVVEFLLPVKVNS